MNTPRRSLARQRDARDRALATHHGVHGQSGNRWLAAISALAILLLLVLSAGLLLSQRDYSLKRAQAQAQREVQRLAIELEQTLRMAQAAIEMSAHGPHSAEEGRLGVHHPLVDSLALPFDLHRLDAADAPGQPAPPNQWLPGLPQQESGAWHVPLTWLRPTAGGTETWQVRLSRDALLSRFASEVMPEGSSMSLFRIDDDGATTVLARYPTISSEQGVTVRGHLATAVARSPSGVFEAEARIDGVRRIVGYRQLAAPGQRLMVVYALGTEGVLAGWYALLPWAVLLTVLVATAMGWGSWRLARSMRELRRSERHFQTLTGHLPDVIGRYDREGRILYINPAVQKATGLAPKDMIGKSLAETGAPDSVAEQWMACLARVFATGQGETLRFDYAGPLGDRHWESQVTLEPGEAGQTPTVLVVSRDITERRDAEARRDAAQRLFESVFMAAPDPMSLGDWESGRLLLVNDAFCELFGRRREDMIGRTSTELGLWRSGEGRQALLDALASGGQVRNQAGTSVRPDGREVHVRYSAERVQVDGHDRLLLMFRDVTQLELDQRALERSELRFRLAAAHGQVWEWDFEQEGGFSPGREFFLRLGHDLDAAAPLNEVFAEVVHPEDLPRLRWQIRLFLKGERPFQMEFRARDASGTYRWFEAYASGLRDPDGRMTYMAGTAFEISDRKALEEAQRQTLAQLETVTNASPALFWTTDHQKRPDWVNQGWLDFTGRTSQDEIGTFWLDDLHPQDRERCAEVFDQAFDAREPYSMEYRLRHHSGEYRWLLEQGRPRYDADNRFIGYIGSCLDLTELKQAEATARERGAMLEQVFDVLQDMLFVVDADERYTFHQAGPRSRLYRQPDAFLGRRIDEVLPQDVAQQQSQAMARARFLGPQEVNYRLDMPDGPRDFNARLAWLPGLDQCMVLVRDTTEQQSAQRERERLSSFVMLLFRLASRFINLPVNTIDDAINDALGDMGRFVDADRAYLFDYDMEAGTASNTHEWCAQGVTPEIDNLQDIPFEYIPDWIDRHRQGQVMHVPDVQALPEGTLRDLLGSQGICSLIALPLMHGERCLGFVGLDSVRHTHNYGDEETTLLQLFAQMLVNIRLRTRAEEQIRELTEGLEQKVTERTTQLEDSVRQLQATNRELEAFTYSASHDLRTPLRGIEGFSALLLEEQAERLDEQGRDYLRRIQKATVHMSQLVSDLLAYSRLQHMTQRIEPVALLPQIDTVTRHFQDELAARHGRLETDVCDRLTVRADAQGLTIVLRNLIDNALKFTPADRAPHIRITACETDGQVRLQVSDNGIGFDMKHHDRIFGMFQRLHRQDQIPGTGIGLAMVHKAVERMGGRIRAESRPGEGSTFVVELPAQAA